MTDLTDMQACDTPLLELARSVPKDLRAEWESQWWPDGTPCGHSMAPVGKYIHDMADALDRLTEFLERGGIDASAVLASEDTGEWRDQMDAKDAEIERMQPIIDAARDMLARLSVTRLWLQLRERDEVMALGVAIEQYDKEQNDG